MLMKIKKKKLIRYTTKSQEIGFESRMCSYFEDVINIDDMNHAIFLNL